MKTVIRMGFAALLGLSVMASTALAAEIKWRLQVYEPPSAITTQLHLRMANEVRKRTKGALSIDIYQPGVLGYSGWGVHRAVSTKQLEMAVGITAAITEIPAYGVFDQPFFTDISEAKIGWDLVKSDLDNAAQAKMGLKLLTGVAKPMAYWIAKKPMATADDIKGMKIRTWNLALSKWVKRMDGVPHSIPYAEMYTSLASGVIEANSSSPVSVLETKVYEVAKYFNMWPSGIVVFATFINLEKYNSLPADVQKILTEEAGKIETESWKLQAAAAAPALEKMQTLGVTIVRPSAEELAKGSAVDKTIYDEWLAKTTPEVRTMAKRVLSALGK